MDPGLRRDDGLSGIGLYCAAPGVVAIQ